MVKRSRPPQWHLLFTAGALLAAVAAGVYLSYGAGLGPDAPPAPARTPAVSVRLGAGPFADSLVARTDSVLAELGLLSTWIGAHRGAGGSGPPPRDTIDVRVPADLPLARVNLALSTLAADLGGHVVRGVERRAITAVDLLVGVDTSLTTLYRLRRDARLQRRHGRLAVILRLDDGDAVTRAQALQQPLTLILPAGAEAPAATPHEWLEAGATPALAGLDWATQATLTVDTLTVGPDGAAGVRRALWALAERAGDDGGAAAWAVGRPETFDALEALLPRLERRGYRFVTVAQGAAQTP